MWIYNFVKESNKIEGILEVRSEELDVHRNFLTLPKITVADLSNVVNVVTGGARLRNLPGMDVRVGNHYPPNGGPEVTKQLFELLDIVNTYPDRSAYLSHCDYETLHPFEDGNGRSGRLLWLWIMERPTRVGYTKRVPWRELGFLHWWYYQSLSEKR